MQVVTPQARNRAGLTLNLVIGVIGSPQALSRLKAKLELAVEDALQGLSQEASHELGIEIGRWNIETSTSQPEGDGSASSGPPPEVADVYKSYADLDGLLTRAISRHVPTQVENVFGQYTAVNAVQQRGKLVADIATAIKGAISGPVVIDSVQVENIDFSDAYEKSIEERMRAEVAVKTREQQLATEQIQARIVVTQAQATRIRHWPPHVPKRKASSCAAKRKQKPSTPAPAPWAATPAWSSLPKPSAGTACCLPRYFQAEPCRSSTPRSNPFFPPRSPQA